MSPNKTPLATVNEEHGGKEKLVEKIMGLLERGEEEKDDLKRRLLAASNRKLLRLAGIAELVKQKYGGKEKLAEAVGQAYGRIKDKDYVRRLGEYTPGRLLDMVRSRGAAAPAAGVAPRAAKPAAKKAAKKAAKPAKGAAKGKAKKS